MPASTSSFTSGILRQQRIDALDAGGGGVKHASGPGTAAPQHGSVLVGRDGGLDRVLFEFAGHERFAPRPASPWAADPDLGGVQTQCDALGGGAGEYIGQGA